VKNKNGDLGLRLMGFIWSRVDPSTGELLLVSTDKSVALKFG